MNNMASKKIRDISTQPIYFKCFPTSLYLYIKKTLPFFSLLIPAFGSFLGCTFSMLVLLFLFAFVLYLLFSVYFDFSNLDTEYFHYRMAENVLTEWAMEGDKLSISFFPGKSVSVSDFELHSSMVSSSMERRQTLTFFLSFIIGIYWCSEKECFIIIYDDGAAIFPSHVNIITTTYFPNYVYVSSENKDSIWSALEAFIGHAILDRSEGEILRRLAK